MSTTLIKRRHHSAQAAQCYIAVTLFDREGYGHSNSKAIAAVSDEQLAGLGLSRNPQDVLGAGKFMLPQGQEFETSSNEMFEKIKAGF